ncbi:MAG: TonB family protein, partial [Pseudomonadota bacterium]
MLAKYGMSVGLGASITFGLLMLMQILIYSGKGTFDAQAKPIEFDWYTVREEIETIEKKPRVPRPKPVEMPPESPKPTTPQIPTTNTNVEFGHLPVTPTLPKNQPGMIADGDVLPLAKVQPIYPRRAQEKGIEGQVLVEFVVTVTGSVRNVTVVESTSSLFNKSAIQA